MKRISATAGLGLAIGIFALSPAIAQSTSEHVPMWGMMGGGCPMMGMMGGREIGPGMMRGSRMVGGMMRGRAGMGAMADGRLAYLKAELQITSAQEIAWQGYADAVTSRVSTMQGMREGMRETMQGGDALKRMDARISGMEAMLGSMKAIKPATETLYVALTADQKTAADQLIGSDCGAM